MADCNVNHTGSQTPHVRHGWLSDSLLQSHHLLLKPIPGDQFRFSPGCRLVNQNHSTAITCASAAHLPDTPARSFHYPEFPGLLSNIFPQSRTLIHLQQLKFAKQSNYTDQAKTNRKINKSDTQSVILGFLFIYLHFCFQKHTPLTLLHQTTETDSIIQQDLDYFFIFILSLLPYIFFFSMIVFYYFISFCQTINTLFFLVLMAEALGQIGVYLFSLIRFTEVDCSSPHTLNCFPSRPYH